jgi:hypothetical protein
MLADTTGNGEYADLYGLDRRWVLLFFDAAALAELMA